MEPYNRIGTNDFIIRQLSLTFYLLDLAKRSNISSNIVFASHNVVWLNGQTTWMCLLFNDRHLYFMRVCKYNVMENAVSYY